MSKISAVTLTLAAIRKAPHALPISAIASVIEKNKGDISPAVTSTAHTVTTLCNLGLISRNATGYYVRKVKRSAVDSLIQRVNADRLVVHTPSVPSGPALRFHQNDSRECVILATVRKAAHALHAEAIGAMLLKKFPGTSACSERFVYLNALVNAGLLRKSVRNDQCYFVPKSKRAFVDALVAKVKLPTIPAPVPVVNGDTLLSQAMNGGDTRAYRHNYND